jgi:hypothetical protein
MDADACIQLHMYLILLLLLLPLCRMGLVLEWVFGSIVSTAEKSRDGAKRCLGMSPPTTQQAYDILVACLEDQAAWEARAKEVRLPLCSHVHLCCLE